MASSVDRVRETFDNFFDRQYEPVVRSLTLVFGDRSRAEDAAQGAFERAYRKWRSVSEMDRPGTWVYVVALRDARRALAREERGEPFGETASGETAVDGMEDIAVTSISVQAALARLPLRQRAAVVLRYLGGLSVSEVAQAMGCAEGTVKATLHAALQRLRVEFSEELVSDAG
ncbi:MAG TPA: sigma-70 family RNA polymerase sigma factor [Thermoleophilia bacterium]|nr:sigma-70 family RNA polymerase sigma factor [Thermoleophilia bacterium]